ncbi:hypothetical protein Bra3105_13805 [Brachybacterium halotolerans subsp. kimchii]|uniref:hypothetical protein n=1 Tax=Brachybacterium halotolerans TaxID=2795215 RepID=UPI001E5F5F28|nr:hypothetical protein [Brachybacterium halotolerans]UEJ81913.1 hypothetical protein Bra3105_13805 [Brachybacterium halotolerans subsp. kimchii]
MASSRGHLENLRHKLFGDRRDQRWALREAGFEDEADAAAWAHDLLAAQGRGERAGSAEGIRRIRAARPDLTLSTARFIARQTDTRFPG